MHWNAAYSAAIADYSEEDCTILRYEDFVADSEGELDRIGRLFSLRPRAASPDALEERHRHLQNSNAEYIRAHQDNSYGSGIWDKFGYDLRGIG